MTDSKLPLAEVLDELARLKASKLTADLNLFCDPEKTAEGLAAALLRQLEAALSGLVGLTQLLSHRDDLPAEVRNLLTTSHRVIAAESAIKAAAAEGEQS